ncbi:hypothetical protein B0H15DRAFT_972671 [Mycena belliarum]|uniref:F-box domain-containing protein n=1 Tax=Mycena belliarum TaxID=1033014 RepID=A0AAD6UBT9_9AGAR|nr:hypothetical protein B0H15DRAFT_972671 [Mycena belliae]
MSAFPPEVWMRIFSFVKDTETFKHLALTSHQFEALAQEEQVRSMCWSTAVDVKGGFTHWRTDPRRRLVQDLDIRLVESLEKFDGGWSTSVPRLQIFANLSTVTLRNGRITPAVHAVLAQLPKLRRLRLQCTSLCAIVHGAEPPASSATVTDLLLQEVRVVDAMGTQLTSDALLARDMSLLPRALLHGLRGLAISSDESASRVLRQTLALIPHAPRLARLSVEGPPALPVPVPEPAQALALPALTAFRGPQCLAALLVPSALALADVALTDELSPAGALSVLAALHPRAVRSVELALTRWDAAVLHEIAHRFAACTRVRLAYCYRGPSDAELLALGAQHLAGMPLLDTLLIHARPGAAVQTAPRAYYGKDYGEALRRWEAEGAAGLREVPLPLSREASMAYLAVWTKWTPRLEVVSLGERLWTRAFGGTVWSS